MIGVFDSGSGGLTAISEIRKLAPNADICFFADRKNAPYGTKTKGELIRLVKTDIKILERCKVDKILMACCTASTVYPCLPKNMRRIAVPIIEPTAREAARVTKSGKVGVIATDATVASGAFTSELGRYKSVLSVREIRAQKLVALIEGGVTDSTITKSGRRELLRILSPLFEEDIDTLILGCTHFPHLEEEIARCFPSLKIVNPSREGAKKILENVSTAGTGRTLYL